MATIAGLGSVEWGADVHAPPEVRGELERVRQLTDAAGLRVASYGSYWRAGVHDLVAGRAVVEAAEALGAPRVRIWAGAAGSERATPTMRRAVVRGTTQLARIADDHGVVLAYEFHADTLADTPDSVLDLLDRVDSAAVRTYWQPPNGLPDEAALDGLGRVLPAVVAVHVFSWWPGTHRLPLAERSGLWRSVIARLAQLGRPVDMLMEFVVDDDPANVTSDAAVLRTLIERSPT